MREPARWLNILLLAGIALRLLVLATEPGINPDDHLGVIAYIADHRALPISNQLAQSYHPPLYYVLMSPLYALTRNSSLVHFGSFAISVANLWLIRRVIDDPLLLLSNTSKVLAFAIVCFGIQIVMFGNFISNDSLTMLIGTAQFWAALRWTERPNKARLFVLALFAGIGLLTKGTLLLAPFVLTAYVLWKTRSWKPVTAFVLIWLIVGSYKFIENQIHFGRPIVHNLDGDHSQIENYSGVWRGWRSVYDINVIKLINRPIMKVRDQLSFPLLMYATAWYPHFPDSSYRGNVTGYAWIGSWIYACAIVPTIVFLIGIVRAITKPQNGIIALAAALLLSNIAIVIAAGVRYDVWACFQSRLCFQSIVPAIVMFGVGMQLIERVKIARQIVSCFVVATLAFSVLYFATEIGLKYDVLPRGEQVMP